MHKSLILLQILLISTHLINSKNSSFFQKQKLFPSNFFIASMKKFPPKYKEKFERKSTHKKTRKPSKNYFDFRKRNFVINHQENKQEKIFKYFPFHFTKLFQLSDFIAQKNFHLKKFLRSAFCFLSSFLSISFEK